MNKTGTVKNIFIAAEKGQLTEEVELVEAVAGVGLNGDRNYFKQISLQPDKRKPENELTLVEYESVEMLNRDYDFGRIEPGELRRNVVTQNIRLNPLVGKTFQIGEVTARGIELCEPCRYLEKLTGKKIMRPLVHKAGLRAMIIKGGLIRKGDEILVED